MARLDPFTAAFVEAALWSTNDESDERGGEPLDANYSVNDIDEATLNAMIAQCADFQKRFGKLIDDDDSPDIQKWGNRELAGYDFWMTRGGHGVGFWEDSDWPKHGAELDRGAKEYGEMWLTVGDDGQIYGSPLDRAPRARERSSSMREGESGYHVMTWGGGAYTSVGWYSTRQEAEKEVARIKASGRWSGKPPKIEAARAQVRPREVRARNAASGRWTVSAGRQINFDGHQFVGVSREGNTEPAVADGMTHLIVELLNQAGTTPDEIYRRHMGHARRARR